jgi:hypothetical protein
MTRTQRIAVLWALFATSLAALFFVPVIGQDPAFHDFADKRQWLGIANFADVISNLGFVLVGFAGLGLVFGPWRKALFDRPADALPYGLIFTGIALTALGSAWYHLDPNNDTLLWDRLPMTIGFMGIFAALLADRVDRRWGLYFLPVLVLAGIASVFYWAVGEAHGNGDLRFYALVQFFPMAAAALILWLFPEHRYTDTRSILHLVGWYAFAKLLEVIDKPVFETLGGVVSGHTLKHVAATVACYCLVHMLLVSAAGRRPRDNSISRFLTGLENDRA